MGNFFFEAGVLEVEAPKRVLSDFRLPYSSHAASLHNCQSALQR